MSCAGVQAELAKLAIYFGEPPTGNPNNIVSQLDKFVKDLDSAIVGLMRKIKFL